MSKTAPHTWKTLEFWLDLSWGMYLDTYTYAWCPPWGLPLPHFQFWLARISLFLYAGDMTGRSKWKLVWWWLFKVTSPLGIGKRIWEVLFFGVLVCVRSVGEGEWHWSYSGLTNKSRGEDGSDCGCWLSGTTVMFRSTGASGGDCIYGLSFSGQVFGVNLLGKF